MRPTYTVSLEVWCLVLIVYVLLREISVLLFCCMLSLFTTLILGLSSLWCRCVNMAWFQIDAHKFPLRRFAVNLLRFRTHLRLRVTYLVCYFVPEIDLLVAVDRFCGVCVYYGAAIVGIEMLPITIIIILHPEFLRKHWRNCVRSNSISLVRKLPRSQVCLLIINSVDLIRVGSLFSFSIKFRLGVLGCQWSTKTRVRYLAVTSFLVNHSSFLLILLLVVIQAEFL